jgi:hypothetical protein
MNPRPAEMTAVLGAEEEVLWEGMPQKVAYVVGGVLLGSPLYMLVIAFFTLAAVVNIVEIFRTGNGGSMIVAPMLSIPFVLWVLHILYLPKRWANEYYLATNQRIIIRTGNKNKYYTVFNNYDIRSSELRISLLNRLLKVGDIHFECGDKRVAYSESVTSASRKPAGQTEVFWNVPALATYQIMQKIVYASKTGSAYQQPQQPALEYPQQLEPQPDVRPEAKKRIIDI